MKKSVRNLENMCPENGNDVSDKCKTLLFHQNSTPVKLTPIFSCPNPILARFF